MYCVVLTCITQLRRYVRKHVFTLTIKSPCYKYVENGNCNVKESSHHNVTVRKSVSDVKLGVMNCRSIGVKLDFVFDHIKDYQMDIMALTGM